VSLTFDNEMLFDDLTAFHLLIEFDPNKLGVSNFPDVREAASLGVFSDGGVSHRRSLLIKGLVAQFRNLPELINLHGHHHGDYSTSTAAT
jgi:hypothetical protein